MPLRPGTCPCSTPRQSTQPHPPHVAPRCVLAPPPPAPAPQAALRLGRGFGLGIGLDEGAQLGDRRRGASSTHASSSRRARALAAVGAIGPPFRNAFTTRLSVLDATAAPRSRLLRALRLGACSRRLLVPAAFRRRLAAFDPIRASARWRASASLSRPALRVAPAVTDACSSSCSQLARPASRRCLEGRLRRPRKSSRDSLCLGLACTLLRRLFRASSSPPPVRLGQALCLGLPQRLLCFRLVLRPRGTLSRCSARSTAARSASTSRCRPSNGGGRSAWSKALAQRLKSVCCPRPPVRLPESRPVRIDRSLGPDHDHRRRLVQLVADHVRIDPFARRPARSHHLIALGLESAGQSSVSSRRLLE